MQRAEKISFKVEHIHWLTKTVYQLELKAENSFNFEAGQFMSVTIPGAGPEGRDLKRAYSIASPPEQLPFLSLCIKEVPKGPGSSFLSHVQLGSGIQAMVPYGDFTFTPKKGRRIVFVSTGTGIAPFRAMMHSKPLHESGVTSVLSLSGVKTAQELLYEQDLRNLEWKVPFEYVGALSQEPSRQEYFQGRVTQYLRTQSTELLQGSDFYLCGNGAMIQEVKAFLLDKACSRESIHQEKYY
jgi:ferredoxin-NADP reductase